jgi:phosphoribosylformylglycinamidine synthase
MPDEMRSDALLFGETQSRIVITSKDQNHQKILDLAKDRQIKATAIGKTGGDRIIINHNGQKLLDVRVDEALKAWKGAIPEIFAIK